METIAVTSKEQIAITAGLAEQIWREAYGELLDPKQIAYMIDKFQSEEAIARQLSEEGYEYYLLAHEGKTFGYLGVQPKDGKLYLSKIYLLPQARGQGHTPHIFAFCQTLARQRGCTAMWLTVNRGNDRAIAAYQKAGFTEIRTQVADIGGGYVMDDFVFEKEV